MAGELPNLSEREREDNQVNYTNEENSIQDLMGLLRDGVKPSIGALFLPLRQREFVWPVNKRVKLIDSVLQGMPIGAVFIHIKEGQTSELDDGGQRLVTLFSYIDPSEDSAFLQTVSCKDKKPAGRWAKKSNKGFTCYGDLDQDQKNRINRAKVSVINFRGTDLEADEMFRRLQLGDSLKSGELIHARTAAPWYPYLKQVEESLADVGRRPKKVMIAGHALAVTVSNNIRVKYNDGIIQSVLDNSSSDTVRLQEASDRATKVLGYCVSLDSRLKNDGEFYATWDIATRYRILFNLLVRLNVTKNNYNSLYQPLRDSLVTQLDDENSPIKTMLKEELKGRRTVEFANDGYQNMFRPVREALEKVVKSRDEIRAFSPVLRTQIRDDNKGLCGGCEVPLMGEWDAHHIVYWENGGLTTRENGQALCVPCHHEAHKTGTSGMPFKRVDLGASAVV
jgi:hypothetical protein